MKKQYHTTEVSKLIHPPLLTNFKQQEHECLESIYFTNKKSVVGKAPSPNIPFRASNSRFGIPSTEGDHALDVLYPSTCMPYLSNYSATFTPFTNFSKDQVSPAGLKSERCDNTGQQMKEIFTMSNGGDSSIIVTDSQRLLLDGSDMQDDCKNDLWIHKNEASAHLDPVKIPAGNFGKGRHLLEVLWNIIKKKNHCTFESLSSAFKSYSGDTEKITVSDLHNMCQKLGISVPYHIVEELLKNCDIIDHDGVLSYEEFIHCLNWKDLMKEKTNIKTSKYANDWREDLISNCDEDILNQFRTIYSFIGEKHTSDPPKTAGLPSVRIDLKKPTLKSVSNFYEYGDVKCSAEILQPDVFAKHGVYGDDLHALQSKQDIKMILCKSGIKSDPGVFEIVWKNVNQNGKASIISVWNNLKKLSLTQSN